MKKVFTTMLLLVVIVSSIAAQSIPIDLGLSTKPPVVFDFPEQHQSVLFFYSAFGGEAHFQAVEVNDAVKVLRTSEIKTLQSKKTSDKIKVIGTFSPKGSQQLWVFLSVGKSEIWQAVIDRTNFTVTVEQRMKNPSKSQLVTGREEGNKFFLVFRQRSKRKGGKLIVYASADGPTFTEHIVPINKSLRMFEKKYLPIVPQKDIEMDPATASSSKNKIYFSNNKMYFVADTVVSLYGYPVSRTVVSWLDLTTYTMSHGLFTCFEKQQQVDNDVSSCVYDDKLFQMCITMDTFVLKIINLSDKKLLFSKTLGKNDSISDLLNTRMVMPAEQLLEVDRTFGSTRKLTRKMLRLDPFIQVRQSGDNYLVGMGGYMERFIPTASGGVGPANIPLGVTTGGYSVKRSAFFYSQIHATDFSHTDGWLPHNFQQQIGNIVDDETGVFTVARARGTFRFGGANWFGYYSKRSDRYIFHKLEE
jgi:hypothetical protein